MWYMRAEGLKEGSNVTFLEEDLDSQYVNEGWKKIHLKNNQI